MDIIRFKFDDKKRKLQAREIRSRVFVEEQNVPEDLEYDEFDQKCQHYLQEHNGRAIATARWRETEDGIKLERFAMLKEFRNRGLGSILLDAVLEDVIPLQKKIYLHAQTTAVNYYSRKGFVTYGEYFYEADIKHIAMQYDLTD